MTKTENKLPIENEYFTLYKTKKLIKPTKVWEFGYEEYQMGYRKYSNIYINYRFGKLILRQYYAYFYKNQEEAIEDLRNLYAGKEMQKCKLVKLD